MDNIEDVRIQASKSSKYIQPYKVLYKQDGQEKFWDCTRAHDSIAVLVYNKTRDTLVLVQQFRPAVYMARNKKALDQSGVFTESLVLKSSEESEKKDQESVEAAQHVQYSPGSEGLTYELCAGIVDKSSSLQQIAKEELLEEMGYDVPLESIQKVTGYCSSIGTSGSYQTMFYCEVTDSMQKGQGGGSAVEGEMIEVIHIPASEAVQFTLDESKVKTSGLCFAFLWYIMNIRSKQ